MRREIRDGVEFVWIRVTPYRGNGINRVVSMVSYVVGALLAQQRLPAPTHVIGSTVHPLAALTGLVAARIHHAPFYFEIRDLWPETLIALGVITEGSLPARLMRWLERFLAERARAVIALFPGTAAYLESRGIRVRRLVVIPNGVDIRTGGATSPSAIRVGQLIDSGHAAGKFVVVYAGAHGTANGLDTVLDAADLLQRRQEATIELVLVGDGPERPRLLRRCRDQRLTNVTMQGPVPKESIRMVLRQADACLVHVARSPIHRYGTSFNKVFDYMASGCPVLIAADAPDDPVTSAQAGMKIPPGDPSALADALTAMRNLPQAERKRLGGNGRRYVREHHDIRRLGERLGRALDA
jgi:glycosyltransferase involved in cell wall biosynthesis